MKGDVNMKKHYSIPHLILDMILIACTGGIWLVWL